MIATRQWHFGHSPTILNHLSRSLVHHLALRVDLVSSSCSIAVVSGRHLYYGDRLRFPCTRKVEESSRSSLKYHGGSSPRSIALVYCNSEKPQLASRQVPLGTGTDAHCDSDHDHNTTGTTQTRSSAAVDAERIDVPRVLTSTVVGRLCR
jgi:hypothetical protein